MYEAFGRILLILFVIRVISWLVVEEKPPEKCTKTTTFTELIDAILKDPSECHQEEKNINKGVLGLVLLSILAIFVVLAIFIICRQVCARVPEKAIKPKSATTNSIEYIPESITVADPTYQPKCRIYTVHVVTSISACQDFIRQIRRHCEDFPVVGFDCEWWSIKGPRRKVALLQLASGGGLCILVRLHRLDSLPAQLPELVELLRDNGIIKVGVQPLDDGFKLRQDYDLQVKSTLDLRHLASRLNVPRPYKLAALAERVVGLEMDTDCRIPASNWEIDELTAIQIEYASKDAIAGLEIFRVLNKQIPLR